MVANLMTDNHLGMANGRQKNLRLTEEQRAKIAAAAKDLGMPVKAGEREIMLASIQYFLSRDPEVQRAIIGVTKLHALGIDSGAKLDRIIANEPDPELPSDLEIADAAISDAIAGAPAKKAARRKSRGRPARSKNA